MKKSNEFRTREASNPNDWLRTRLVAPEFHCGVPKVQGAQDVHFVSPVPAVLEPRAHFTRKVRFPGSGAGPGGLAYLVHQARTNGNPFPHALDRGAEPPFRAKTLPPAVLF